jgi:hypothetical protein
MARRVEDFASSETPKEIVISIKRWVRKLLSTEERNGYFLSFMFEQMKGSHTTLMSNMRSEVERFYSRILTRIIRTPNSKTAWEKMPLFIGCPDLPVWKHEKVTMSTFAINDGFHFNGIFLLSKKSRLKTGFKAYMNENGNFYADGKRGLKRIHVSKITKHPGYATDYALKALKHGRIGYDELLILPKHTTEQEGTSDLSAQESVLG